MWFALKQAHYRKIIGRSHQRPSVLGRRLAVGDTGPDTLSPQQC